jgi:hypothetical protein
MYFLDGLAMERGESLRFHTEVRNISTVAAGKL